MKVTEEEYLAHYGTPRHSGRYPWGSGGDNIVGDNDNYPRNQDFLQRVDGMKQQGLSEKEIADGMGMSIKDLRARKSNYKAEQKATEIRFMEKLKEKGTSNTEIAKRMGMPESTVRAYLAPGAKDRHDATQTTANMLKAEVDEKVMVDVGGGVENRMNIPRTRLENALAALKDQGYVVETVKQPQIATGHETVQKVLAQPGMTQKDIFKNRSQVQQIGHFSDDMGRTTYGLLPPMIVNPKRLSVVYGKEGKQADGIVYVRPGVEDVSLGGVNYSQVRIRIGDGHYLKGMAMYKSGLPRGVDLQFNTAKADTGNKLDALKEVVKDIDGNPDDKNPFGAYISNQVTTGGEDSRELVSAMNIVNEEGDWATWSRNLSSQFLSKQNPKLARTQLDMTYERREQEFKAISELTNATVKKKMMDDFAGSTDSAAAHLKAAQLPRQSVAVILPIHDMPESQVYAPRFNDGETVVLIRHPHGGTFEIPRLVVNNEHPTAKRLLGHDAIDAIGIHSSVAERLSGADFDGDTVLVIPDNDPRKILDTKALDGLKNFDPVSAYPPVEGVKVMANTQTEMGMISNLITDMSLKNASPEELTRAVKHSMVVIDAEKKKLNYRLSAQDNGIAALKKKYQQGGASTLISRKKREITIPDRKPRTMAKGGPIDKVTGRLMFEPTGKTRIDKKGNRVPVEIKVGSLAEATDAHTLSSGTKMEDLYANHSNKLKALANRARLEALNTPTPKQSSSAKKAYAAEVKSLEASLDIANRNRPLERHANIIADSAIRLKKQANPNMEKDTLKKVKRQQLEEARIKVGAKAYEITISPKEWEAIQANAISNNKLTQILNFADTEKVRELATPKTSKLMTPTKTKRAQDMIDLGYSRSQIAQQLGVSLSTLYDAIKE